MAERRRCVRPPVTLILRPRQALAALKSVATDQIFIGNGSDEAIDMLMRAFVEPGCDNVVLLPPTYGMYAVQANIHGAEIRRAPLRADFSPDAAAVMAISDEHSKLLFLCSPNNPTGQCLHDDFILDMLERFPGLVVIDEAYGDFTGRSSWLERLAAPLTLLIRLARPIRRGWIE